MNNKIISVWGSPYSGKTTLSIKLAKELNKQNKNVALIFPNSIYPTIVTVLPLSRDREDNDKVKSLGRILSKDKVTRESIYSNCVTLKKNHNLAIIGYDYGENSFTYPKFTRNKIHDLLTILSSEVDHIIIECSSNLDLFTTFALEVSSKVIRVTEPNTRSLSYFESNLPLLIDNNFNLDEHIVVMSKIYSDTSTRQIKEKYNVKYEFPYLDEIRQQFVNGEMFEDLRSKERYSYNKAFRELMDDIFKEKIDKKVSKTLKNIEGAI